MAGRRIRPTPRRILAACSWRLAVLAAATSACGGTSVGVATPPAPALSQVAQPSHATSATSTAASTLAPLTGLPASDEVANHAAVAVAASLPVRGQLTGLGSADVVFEAWLGNGATRLLAVFQSHDPTQAGPVAGTLPSDGPVLSVLHPVLADTGGPPGFVKTLHSTTVIDATPTNTPRGYSGSAPSWSALPSALRAEVAATASAPPPLFLFGDRDSLPPNQSKPASSLVITATGRAPERWSYDPSTGRWQRTDGSGLSVSVTNLVVQTVGYVSVLVHHPGTAKVSIARPFGTGKALVLSGPSATAATWTKPGPTAVTNFVDGGEVPVWFRPGSTWVALVPEQADVAAQ